MEDRIKGILHNGESLLWTGEADRVVTLNRTYGKNFRNNLIIVIIAFIALMVFYAFLCHRNNVDINWIIVVMFGLICAIPIINIFTEATQISKALYLATDSRLIIVVDEAKDIEYEKIHSAAFKTDEDGQITLLCGDRALKSKPHTWRSASILGNLVSQSEEEGPCQSFAFYAVNDPEGLRKVLENKINVTIA